MATSSPSHPAGSTAEADAALPSVPWERVERFVGQLAHDIRNGLNALELQLTFLGEISTDPEAVEEVKRIRSSMGNVTRQLQTLRNATGAVKPYPLEYPAPEFFDDLRERHAKLHPDAKDRVVWEVDLRAGFMLNIDPELTINALLELLNNALAFGDDDDAAQQPVRATVSAGGDRATVVLSEPRASAPDVAPADWGRTPLLTTRRGAYGLGLFRARRIVQAQGGALLVDYSAENRRLTTTVTLPGVSPLPS